MGNPRGRRTNGSLKASKGTQRGTISNLMSDQPLAARPKVSIVSNDDSQDSSDGGASSTPSTTDSTMKPLMNGTKPKMMRKSSSPMAPAFMVSAPGKVIVYGEHAVVHGKAAMAAAISLRSYLLVTTLSKSQRTVTMNFRDIGLDHTWNIDDLPWDVFHHPSKKKFYYNLVTSLDPELVDAIQPHVDAVSPDKPEDVRKIHRRSASAFLYLFLSLGSPQTPGAIYTLRSTIPIGAGLGSSASVCVCLSAALLLQIRTLAGPHPDQPPDEAETQIERINRWAFVGEMCTHGNPSGVDNTVSAGGKAVIFRREDYTKPPTVIPLPNFPELPLLLVDTRQARSTAAEVAKVGKLKDDHPVVTEAILDAIDKVTLAAQEAIQDINSKGVSAQILEHLGTLIRINHGFLVSLGVSHPRLERIRELVDYANIGWTKLTGAGGGGCAITVLRPDVKEEAVRDLEQKLSVEGFEKYETTLGGDGIGVLWPAVLRNGTDEEGGEEIDQQKFENAVGTEGIERLVGVGVQEKREGWKFWKRATHFSS
ncbi:mevalonate kinase [Aspergillus clavatus NRRL 1]|uniref:Mevalonate kinase n=1 Tax=Aspergillus clavatus (strain ATCC 1007 / CBS 513.65 / DSM 816 / NCTC 3887 / NRRL 1 / QM 1276 / 107) TaxID=344612 RepID=A1CH91_ASPCL|nr:mevalonate kinase [Aspergillus clavatus NRRL 1]EAW10246.1 mevalonate kinase [Aspergillus clavatus NRRL 1]